MTNDQKDAIKAYLKQLNGKELNELRQAVEEEIEDQWWCDENFWMRETIDSYIYITIFDDLTYHYDYLGSRAYERYMSDPRAVRIEYKTKDLFPTYGTLMARSEL